MKQNQRLLRGLLGLTILLAVAASTHGTLAQESGLRVIASGGVASLADIRALAGCTPDLTGAVPGGVEGVIVGQALYTGAIDLDVAVAAAKTVASAGAIGSVGLASSR